MKTPGKVRIFLALWAGLAGGSFLQAGTILPIYEANYSSLDLELDPYYSSVDFYLTPFGNTNKNPPLDENRIYGELLKTFFFPRTILLEASIYPLPILGAVIRQYWTNGYQAVQIGSNFNLVKLFTVKYSEPWAFSLFVGNHLKYKPRPPADTNANEGLLQPFFKEEMAQREGTAYSGVLFTFGPHLLIQNVFFQRPWFEVEVKIKGKIATSQKVLGWDFKVGMRYVFSNEIEPTVYASVSRDRTDFNDARLSIIKNTRFDLRMDKGLGTNNFWRFTAIVGKNFPIKKSRFAFSLSVGAIININSPYDGKLTGLDPLDLFHMVFQPGLIF